MIRTVSMGVSVEDNAAQDGLVGLPEAIESLRADLTLAWRKGLAMAAIKQNQ